MAGSGPLAKDSDLGGGNRLCAVCAGTYRRMAGVVMRNLTAADLGLELFCGAEPRKAGDCNEVPVGARGVGACTEIRHLNHTNPASVGCDRDASAEMPTAPTHFEFNELSTDDGPDPFDNLIETELERENIHEDYDYE